MTFDWYKIFNLAEFMALNLVSRSLTVVLEGAGEKDILIVRGNTVSIVFEDVFLPIEFEDDNPFVREGDEKSYAVYKDESGDVWLGIEASA